MRFHFAAATAFAVAVLLTGCAPEFTSLAPSQSTIGPIHGSAYGGHQPIKGAHIYLFETSNTGYGGPGEAPGSGNKVTSLLKAYSTGSYPTSLDSTGTATDGFYYVTTDTNGGFGLTNEYTACDTGRQVFIYSLGGDTGGGTNNSAAGLFAVLGTCGSFGAGTSINMNEVSTIAAAYAMAGFATDATHVGILDSPLAETGITNAFANSALLDNTAIAGTGSAPTNTANGNGIVPQKQIDTLANIIAACVDSSGSTSTQCNGLFTDLMSGGTSGSAATDTATEAIYMAHNPYDTNVYDITGPGAGNPYSPWFNAIAPNDFTVALQFFGGGISNATGVAIDAQGNVWTANSGNNTLSKLASNGTPVSTDSGYVGGGLSGPSSIAFDLNGNVWATNNTSPFSVSEFSSSGVPTSSIGYSDPSLNHPNALALDGNGNAWVSNFVDGNSSTAVTEFSGSLGAAISPSGGFTAGSINQPDAVAIDPSGNVWISDYGANALTKLSCVDGSPLSPVGGYVNGGLNNPTGLAIDVSGNVWVANQIGTSVSVFAHDGTLVTPSGYGGGGINEPAAIAIDGGGNAWLANQGNQTISEISSAGQAVSPANGYTSGGLTSPNGLAVDGSGNIWVADSGGTIKEYIGIATPVVTPLVSGVKNNKLGSRP